MNQKTDYTGTPEEVGAQLAADALGPTITETMATHNATSCARMMSGMVAFMAGAVAENFGPEAAESMLRGTADKVAGNTAQLLGKVN